MIVQGTKMKHKHCELIKAWADGAEIQARETSYFSDDDNVWVEIKTPTWSPYIEYRIKPKTIKYRLFLQHYEGEPTLRLKREGDSLDPESWKSFIRWLGDWQEVKV